MRNIILTTIVIANFSVLICCTVKDKIYNTSHPDHGKITINTDWSNCAVDLEIPSHYTIKTDDFSQTVSGIINTLDHLFIFNDADNITINGAVAKVANVAGNVTGLTGNFIHNNPGWLYTDVVNVLVEKDDTITVKARMNQQVRQLTLIMETKGNLANEITGIEGYISGFAGAYIIDENSHGEISNISLNFSKITTGTDAGKWSVTVRVIGIAGSLQKFGALLHLENRNPQHINLESDLSAELSNFNTDKKTPYILRGKIAFDIDPDVEAGFTATIRDWKEVAGGSGIAK